TPLYVFLFPSSRLAPRSTLFPYTTLFRLAVHLHGAAAQPEEPGAEGGLPPGIRFTGHRLDEAKRPGAGRPDQPRADDRRLVRLDRGGGCVRRPPFLSLSLVVTGAASGGRRGLSLARRPP